MELDLQGLVIAVLASIVVAGLLGPIFLCFATPFIWAWEILSVFFRWLFSPIPATQGKSSR